MSNLFAVPAELRALPNWLLWKLEYPNGPDKKPGKIPYSIKGHKASSMDASHWVTFEVAFNALQLGGYDGLGFVFTNTEYTGIDLDDARYKPDGSANPSYETDYARQIKVYHEFNSYAERSPSGKGCHIIVKGKVPDGKKQSYIEVYPSGRFFTMTGDVVNDVPVKDCTDLLNQLWVQMGGEKTSLITGIDKPSTQSDEDILRLCLTHNADKFTPLLNGDIGWYASRSEADQAFMNIIAYYTDSRDQCYRIFLNSKLGNHDAKRKRPDYINRTITKAFDLKIVVDFQGMNETYDRLLAASSNSRTTPFDGANDGANPSAASNSPVAQRLEPSAHNRLVAGSNPAGTTIIYPPGLLGEIASFIYDSAPRPVAEIALAAAIGLMAGMCGRAYNISNTGLNQYVLLLAMTGAGKEAAASGINNLMTMVKASVPAASEFIGPSEISSGAALFKYLGNNSKSFVCMLGEFGLRLQQMSSPNANGSEVSLRRMFLDLYNKSGGTQTLQASIYSDKANNTAAVQAPAFSIIGESTPERFYGALNEDMISEGLLPRFLLIEYKGGRVPLNVNAAKVQIPIPLGNRLSELAAHCLTINNSIMSNPIQVQCDTAASSILAAYDKAADLKINGSEKEVIRQLWNRAHIKVLKLAALVSVGINPYNPIVTEPCVQWAIDLVARDIEAITVKFESGEIGLNSNELKQYNEAIRISREYATKDFDYAKKYGAVQNQHKQKIINNTFLHTRLARLSAFKNDKIGANGALRRIIQLMIDTGHFVELKGEALSKLKTTARCFYVNPSILDEQ